MTRPTLAQIRLSAFLQNYRLSKALSAGKSLAVIKANAYGHGAVQCAQTIQDEADGFAVCTLEEAAQLRDAGIRNPILLLEGFFEVAELPKIIALDCWVVIHACWQVEALTKIMLPKPLHIWLKMDSGMHRLGLSPATFLLSYQQLAQHPNVANIVAMTHFANADHLASAHTAQQTLQFLQHLNALPMTEVSLKNSAAILSHTNALADGYACWSRPGIMLYGADPLWSQQPTAALLPVMVFTSKIIAVQQIKAGEAIGYGSIFTAQRDSTIGVVACGYADGYPRSAINAPVAVDGVMTTVVGRVSMDMLSVDLTDLPAANVGSVVELWGEKVSVNDVAAAANTIAYELLCNVKRAKFAYSCV